MYEDDPWDNLSPETIQIFERMRRHQRIEEIREELKRKGKWIPSYLHHYSLNSKQKQLFLNELNYLIEIKNTTQSRKVLYVTTEPYVNSDYANQMLSLTYYPKYDSVIETEELPSQGFEITDNLWKNLDLYRLMNELDTFPNLARITNVWPKNLTRVWPAFGKTGGAHELLILERNPSTKPLAVIPTAENKLPNGGAVEMWHQDAVYITTWILHRALHMPSQAC